MWVINQDGLAVVKVDSLALDPSEVIKAKDDSNAKIRIWGSIADHDFVMGVYNSVDEAKSILGMFAEHVRYNTAPFVMPEALNVGDEQ